MKRKWIIDLHFGAAEDQVIRLNTKLEDTAKTFYEIGAARKPVTDRVGVYYVETEEA